MSREADYDIDLFAEMVRSGARPQHGKIRYIRGVPTAAPVNEDLNSDEKNKKL